MKLAAWGCHDECGCNWCAHERGERCSRGFYIQPKRIKSLTPHPPLVPSQFGYIIKFNVCDLLLDHQRIHPSVTSFADVEEISMLNSWTLYYLQGAILPFCTEEGVTCYVAEECSVLWGIDFPIRERVVNWKAGALETMLWTFDCLGLSHMSYILQH